MPTITSGRSLARAGWPRAPHKSMSCCAISTRWYGCCWRWAVSWRPPVWATWAGGSPLLGIPVYIIFLVYVMRDRRKEDAARAAQRKGAGARNAGAPQ
ncbi:MAG: hypothetical protein IPM07_13960 [Anaerolineales bacterium]|nr:hypothetical protein [Anaerolineales bacterium]